MAATAAATEHEGTPIRALKRAEFLETMLTPQTLVDVLPSQCFVAGAK
jgi:hypothetical protein